MGTKIADVIYSSEIKRNKQILEDIVTAIGKVERVLIFVRQNPRKNILDISGGIKEKRTNVLYVPWRERRKNKTYNYYYCSVTEETDLKRIVGLIKIKINSIHWIEIY